MNMYLHKFMCQTAQSFTGIEGKYTKEHIEIVLQTAGLGGPGLSDFI